MDRNNDLKVDLSELNRYSIKKSSLTGKKGNDQFITGMLCWIVIFVALHRKLEYP